MSGTWFTADLHFGHELVSKLRGFDDTDAHDALIRWNWTRRIKDDDFVWVLGDLSGGSAAREQRALEILRDLPGHKRLIFGNHDAGHPMHRDAHKVHDKYGQAFESWNTAARLKICKQTVLLSHFPYAGDHTRFDRYQQWRLPDMSQWLIHGHTHSSVPRVGRSINVALEARNMCPVTLGQINTEMMSTLQ